MLHLAAQVARDALPAYPAPAQVGHLDTGRLQRFEQAVVARHLQTLATARQLDGEGLARLGCGEGLPVQAPVRPAVGASQSLEFIEQALRAADVKVTAKRLAGEQAGAVQALAGSGVVAMKALAQAFAQLVGVGVGQAAAVGVMQFERSALRLKLSQIGHEWRDADAPGHQDVMTGLRVQGEQIARRADLQSVADAHLLVQVTRATTRALLQAHGDTVHTGLARIAQQRIGVAQRAPFDGQHHLHMAAAGKTRQRAVDSAQAELTHHRGKLAHVGDLHLDHRAHADTSGAKGLSGSMQTPM